MPSPSIWPIKTINYVYKNSAMRLRATPAAFGALAAFILLLGQASAQTLESVGNRALGMGGAFVAVASDASATWWNPAALAAGPFLDIMLFRTVDELTGPLPALRERASGAALVTPPFGVSYYRFQVTDAQPPDSIDEPLANREEKRTGTRVRSLAASQFGLTLLHTVMSGIHVGTTIKYIRGTVRTADGVGLTSSALLDQGDDLEGGAAQGQFDVDVGVLATRGAFRVGALMRHLAAPQFGSGGDVMVLPRSARVGVAYDGSAVGQAPFVLSIDADVTRVATALGDRRVIAVGAERWLGRRVGVRAGARFNTVGSRERAATAGGSLAVRSGLYVEGFGVRGGAADDRGWGIGARVTF
jgi:hypothetical protein